MSSNVTRKIPKIVHMTSKGRCFTKAFADNIKQWTLPGYSFVLHDDEAVEKLFHNYEWTEFPLLRHVLTCLTSGAMKADLWRYLALWKWGGVYTDMDNAPGREWFKEGTFINDTMDAMFEIERGGYPSQYFYAISPHHPASYFMLSAAIQRIIFNDKPMNSQGITPILTGPGGLKHAIVRSFGGSGYPMPGTYIGRSNRSMAILGSRRDARQSRYVGRCIIRNAAKGDEAAMNMTHYLDKSSRTSIPRHTCRLKIMKDKQH
ncbi:hypothetical protein CTEN210_16376 [Chaetoceros tenuissimus]|uniref:Uncharacterized protein n=1 Tax=Chaetoceros tenuissimus TaxID=426638 RepID=A0AAD3HDR8_9STRA|nr:hypothetical protein CTEN210_16376 [Chaetoceros tenuissimus]